MLIPTPWPWEVTQPPWVSNKRVVDQVISRIASSEILNIRAWGWKVISKPENTLDPPWS